MNHQEEQQFYKPLILYNGDSKFYLEVDVRKLTDSEMVWYHTDSNEEIARFTKEK